MKKGSITVFLAMALPVVLILVFSLIESARVSGLRTAAKVSGNKSCEMLHVKDLLQNVGYVRGACSPIGMKKDFPAFFDETVILCCFGGRLDHAFANIQAGAYAAERGAAVRLCGEDTEAWIFRDRSLAFPRRAGYSFSVFSLTDTCSATIAGAEYECRDLAIRNTFPVGVSNEWKEEQITVTAGGGILMVMESRMDH